MLRTNLQHNGDKIALLAALAKSSMFILVGLFFLSHSLITSLPIYRSAVSFEDPCDVCTTSGIYITEVMYNADGSDTGCEYIELFNGYSNDVDISGWTLSDGVSYTFPSGTIIGSGDYLLITNGTSNNCNGPTNIYDLSGTTHKFSGALTNTSETITLSSNGTCGTSDITTTVTYDDDNGADDNGNAYYFSIATPGAFLAEEPPTPGTGDCLVCSDMSSLTCFEAMVNISKDDNDNNDDLQTIVEGSDATFSVTITNTGNEILCDILISDPNTPSCALSTSDIQALIEASGNGDKNWDPGEVLSYTCTSVNVLTSFTNSITINAKGCDSNDAVEDSDDSEVFVQCLISNIVAHQICTNNNEEYELCITFDWTGRAGSTEFDVYVGDSTAANLVGTYTYNNYQSALISDTCFTIPMADFLGDASDLESDIKVFVSDHSAAPPGTGLPVGSMSTGGLPDLSCPQIIGILADACGSPESLNEFIVLKNGDEALDPSTLDFDTPSGNDYDDFVSSTSIPSWTCPCCSYIDNTSTIPADAVVIVTTENNDSALDFTSLCTDAPGGTVFVLQDNSTSTTGHFSNSAGRATVFTIAGTSACDGVSSYSYTTASVANGDGDYTMFVGPDNPGVASAGSPIGTPDPGNMNLAGSCTPDIAASSLSQCYDVTTYSEESCCEETTTNLDSTICQGNIIDFNDLMISTGGIFRDTLLDASMCDSFIVLNVTVADTSQTIIDSTICQGDIIDFNDLMIMDAGQYRDTLTNVAMCDSFIVLNVTVSDTSQTVIDSTICQGDILDFNDLMIMDAGQYRDTLTNVAMCDSFIVLNVTVTDTSQTIIDSTICQGDVINFNDLMIMDAGQYRDTLTNVAMCDSFIVLNVTVSDTSQTVIDSTICQGDIINFNDLMIMDAGQYRDTLTNVAKCDSFIVLNLFINPIDTTDIALSICSDESYTFNEKDINVAGIYLDTLKQSNSCDSIIRLTLSIDPTPDNPIISDIEFCFDHVTSTSITPTPPAGTTMTGDHFTVTWDFEGDLFDGVSNLGSITSMNAIKGTDLGGSDFATGNTNRALSSTGWNDNEPNDYLEFCITATSADISITEFSFFDRASGTGPSNFEIFSSDDNFTTAIGSGAVSVGSFGATAQAISGLNINITTGAAHCFRIRTAGASSGSGTYRVDDVTIMGSTIITTPSAIVYNFFSNATGTPIPTAQGVTSYDPGVTAPGTYDYWLTATDGMCTSDTIKTSIIIHPTPSITASNQTICAGDSILLSDLILGTTLGTVQYGTSFGTYPNAITSFAKPNNTTTYFIRDSIEATGCIDTTMLTITVNEVKTGTETHDGCQGDDYSVTVGLSTYNEANPTGIDTLKATNGCDSIVTTTLVFKPNATGTETHDGCKGDGYSVTVGISTYNEANPSGMDILPATNGCDSVVTTLLIFKDNAVGEEIHQRCMGDDFSVTVGSSLYNEANPYGTDILIAANGCDSVVTTMLTFKDVLTSNNNYTGCSGDGFSIMVGSTLYNEANPSGMDTFTSSLGCDSIVTTTLIFKELPADPVVSDITFCFGDGTSTSITPTPPAGTTMAADPFTVTWDFEGEVLTAASNLPAISGSNASKGVDLGNFTFPAGNSSTDALSANNWNDEAEDYIEFCVSAATTNILITDFSFFDDVSGTGPTTYTVFSSDDGYTTAIGTGSTNDPFAATANAITGLTINVLAGATQCFRIFATGATSNSGIMRVDDVMISGSTVVSTPSAIVYNFFSDAAGTPIASAQGVTSYNPGVIASGTYDYWVTSTDGLCTSNTVKTSIIIHPNPSISGSDQTICAGDSILLSDLLVGTTLGTVQYGTSFGSYPNAITAFAKPTTTTNYFIRDSVIATSCIDTTMITITINEVKTGIETHDGCIGDNYSVTVGMSTYNETNLTGIDTLMATNGCDSIVTTTLVFKPNATGIETHDGCTGDGYSVTVGMSTYNEANPSGMDLLLAANGCDSVVTTLLTFKDNAVGEEIHQRCMGDGFSVTVATSVYNEANPFGMDTLPSANGCDSVVTTMLTFKDVLTSNNNYSGCSGDGFSIMVGSNLYNEANPSGMDIFTSSSGCDSIVSTKLIFNELPADPDVSDISFCFGDGTSTEIIPTPPAGGLTSQPFDIAWSFEGEVLNAVSNLSSISGSNASKGADLGNFTFPSGNNSIDALSANNWNDQAGDYIEFCVSAATTDILITDFSFFDQASGTGPMSYTVFSLDDGYTTAIGSGSTNNSFAATANAITGLTLSVTAGATQCFRIFATGATSNSGTFRVDDVIISGMTVVPPSPTIVYDFLFDANGTIDILDQGVISYDPQVNAVGTYNYLVVATDGSCFSDTVQTSITINAIPDINNNELGICIGESISLADHIVGTPLGSVSYGTSPGSYTDTITTIVSPSVTTTYYVRDSVVSTGCTDVATITVTVTGPKLQTVEPLKNTCPSKTVDLSMAELIDINNVSGTPFIFYYSDSLSAVNGSGSVLGNIVNASGTYYARYEILGCSDVLPIKVDIAPCCDIDLDVVETICFADGTFEIRYTVDYTDALGDGLAIRLGRSTVDTIPYPSNSSVIMSVQSSTIGSGSGSITLEAIDTSSLNNSTSSGRPFISEIHYDNIGTDIDEGIEISIIEAINLDGYTVHFYNGSNGEEYLSPVQLSDIDNPDRINCESIYMPAPGMQNGPDGIALVDPSGNVLEFISYEGVVTAVEGPANGLTSTDVLVFETSSTPVDESLQLTDLGWINSDGENSWGVFNDGLSCIRQVDEDVCSDQVEVDIPFCSTDCELNTTFESISCVEDAAIEVKFILETFNTLSDSFAIIFEGEPIETLAYPANQEALICSTLPLIGRGTEGHNLTVRDLASTERETGIFISEIHYDNNGVDENEGIEITAPSNTSLENYQLLLYNGADGSVYRTFNLSSVTPDLTTGCSALFFNINNIQNGPDAIALVEPDGSVLQFISYEGSFEATEGAALGLTSIDINVSEDNNTSSNQSLQLSDEGWTVLENSRDILNNNLTCVIATPLNICESVLIIDAPMCPLFDLTLTKNLSPDQASFVEPGDTVSWDLVVTNEGEASAFDIVVQDHFPSEFSYSPSYNDTGWQPDATYVAIPEISPGEGIIIQIRMIIDPNFNGSELTNVAEIIRASLSPGGPDAADFDDELGTGTTSEEDADLANIFICHSSASDIPIVEDLFLCDALSGSATIMPFSADPLVLFEDFETDGLGDRYTLSIPQFTDNNGNYFIRTDGANTSVDNVDIDEISGSFWFGAQDLDGEGGPNQATITLAPQDIRGLCNLNLSVLLAEDDASDGNEDWDGQNADNNFVHIDYSVDGITFVNGIHIESSDRSTNTPPSLDTDFDGVGDGQEVTNVFSRFGTPIALLGDSIIVRITINLEDNDEDIAIDDITITGKKVAYNIYDNDPDLGGVLLADSVTSFVPATPSSGASDTYWISNRCGICEGSAIPVSVSTHPVETSIACYATANIVVGEDCSLGSLDLKALYPADIDPIFFTLILKDASGAVVDTSDLSSHIGEAGLIYQLTDNCTETLCWGYITLEAKSIPEPIRIKDTICCSDRIENILISEIEVIELLSEKCIASYDQIRLIPNVEGSVCDSINYIYSFYADFINDDKKESALVFEQTVTILPLLSDDIQRPGSENLGSSIALADTIVIEACGDFDFSPDNIAHYWSQQLDPADKYKNGNNEGIPYAYPYVVKDSTDVALATIFPRVIQSIVKEEVLINGLWVLADVVKKDTISDSSIVIETIPNYLPLDSSTVCNFSVKYTDVYKKGCFEKTKLIREWSILDWCNGAVKEFRQFIEVKDTEAPKFNVIVTEVEVVNPDSILVNGELVAMGDATVNVDIDFEKLFRVIDITNAQECSASFEVPIFDRLKDNCTAFEDITYSYTINDVPVQPDKDNPRLLHGFQSGSSTLMITATDRCGNSATHKMTIFALDKAPPKVLCRDQINVSLIEDRGLLDGGQVLVPLELFDIGTYDECGEILLVLARRLDNKFFCNGTSIQAISTSALEFCCEDIGSGPIPISLTYFDNLGNTSKCWTTVLIEGDIIPELSIEDQTIACHEGLSPEDLGYPNIRYTCEAPTLLYEDIKTNYDSICGHGYIIRRWSLEEYLQVITDQIINIQADSQYVINPYDIKWPRSYTGAEIDNFIIYEPDDDSDSCKIWTADQINEICLEYPTATCLDSDFEEPILPFFKCGIIATTYEDQPLETFDGSCKKIIRRWTIIDWCNYKPNEIEDNSYDKQFVKDRCLDEEYYRYTSVVEDGSYQYEQVIKVVDEEAPLFTTCDTIISYVDGSCKSTATLLTKAIDQGDCGAAQLEWTAILKDSNDDILDTQAGVFNTTDSIMWTTSAIDIGNYKVSWEVHDGCGNMASCIQSLSIIDTVPPEPICIQNLSTVILSDQGTASIWAADYHLKSVDNCKVESAYFKDKEGDFSDNLTLSCRDILTLSGSVWTGELWVVDESGNASSCNISLDIRDQSGICGNGEIASVAGAIYTYQNKTIEGVEVTIDNYKDRTLAQGQYAFSNMPTFQSYEIKAYKNDDLLNGVTAVDMVLIQRHIVGKQKIESPYLQIAADVNNDGRISAIDLVVLRNAILGRSDQFTNNTSWKFIDALYDMSENISLAPYDQTINIERLNNSITDANFIGVKIGDINDNASTNSLNSGNRSIQDLEHFTIDDQVVVKGQEVSLVFQTEDISDIEAFQFTLSTSQVAIKDVYSDQIYISTRHTWQYEDGLTMAWHKTQDEVVLNGKDLFTIKLTALQDGKLSDLLEMNSDITKALIYRKDHIDTPLDLQYIDSKSPGHTGSNKLYQNVPNPFSKETVIGFELNKAGETTLSIFDIAGTTLYEVTQVLSAGYNEIKIDGQSINDSGVLIYRLEQGGYSDYKKMILID